MSNSDFDAMLNMLIMIKIEEMMKREIDKLETKKFLTAEERRFLEAVANRPKGTLT